MSRIIQDYLQEHPELFAAADIQEIVGDADEMSDQEFDRLAADVFRGPKTADVQDIFLKAAFRCML